MSLDAEFSLQIETDSGELDLNLLCLNLLYDIFPGSTVCLVFPPLSKMALAWYVVALRELKPQFVPLMQSSF